MTRLTSMTGSALQVGSLLKASWGIDGAFVAFYVVTKAAGRRVSIARVAGGYGVDGGPSMPLTITGAEERRHAQPHQGRCRVKVADSIYALPVADAAVRA